MMRPLVSLAGDDIDVQLRIFMTEFKKDGPENNNGMEEKTLHRTSDTSAEGRHGGIYWFCGRL